MLMDSSFPTLSIANDSIQVASSPTDKARHAWFHRHLVRVAKDEFIQKQIGDGETQ
jgi:hypothetical protein